MLVKKFKVGGDRNFGYLAADENSMQAVIIDPAYNPDMIIDFADENGFQIKYIFNTHGHSDHTNGNRTAKKRTGIKPLGYGDRDKLSGQKVKDSGMFPLGNLNIKIIYTPGHTDDSICIYVGDALFTGDTLFVGKVGGTDYGKQAQTEFNSLQNKLVILPDDTRVFPGHDYGFAPESTIGNEKKTNPFLLQPDFESFVNLKKNWLDYKKKHGIA